MNFGRYAIYFTPQGQLGARGAAWLGWDSAQGQPAPQPDFPGVDLARITQKPRRYGCHATIMAPFSLRAGQSQGDLIAACAAAFQGLAAAQADGLRLAVRRGFLALIPTGDQAAIRALAAQVVTDLAPLRAPLTPDQQERRSRANLTAQQRHNLAAWGYPYVMDDFDFHITLTGRLGQAQCVDVLTALAPFIAPHLPNPFRVAKLTLMGEDADGFFHQITDWPLQG